MSDELVLPLRTVPGTDDLTRGELLAVADFADGFRWARERLDVFAADVFGDDGRCRLFELLDECESFVYDADAEVAGLVLGTAVLLLAGIDATGGVPAGPRITLDAEVGR